MGRRQDRQVWRGQSFELVLLRLSLGRENIFACIILTFLYDQSEAIRNLTWRYIVCQLICFALLLHFCTYQVDTIRQWFCLGFVHVSPPNSFKPERVVFTCIKSWKKSSVHIRWLGSSKATSGGDRWRTGTVLSSGSDPARRRPQCACNRFTWYFLHTFHLTNQRSNYPMIHNHNQNYLTNCVLRLPYSSQTPTMCVQPFTLFAYSAIIKHLTGLSRFLTKHYWSYQASEMTIFQVDSVWPCGMSIVVYSLHKWWKVNTTLVIDLYPQYNWMTLDNWKEGSIPQTMHHWIQVSFCKPASRMWLSLSGGMPLLFVTLILLQNLSWISCCSSVTIVGLHKHISLICQEGQYERGLSYCDKYIVLIIII